MRSGAKPSPSHQPHGKALSSAPDFRPTYIEEIFRRTAKDLPTYVEETDKLLARHHTVAEANDLLDKIYAFQAPFDEIRQFLERALDQPTKGSPLSSNLSKLYQPMDVLAEQIDALDTSLGNDIDTTNIRTLHRKNTGLKAIQITICSSVIATIASKIMWGPHPAFLPELLLGCVSVGLALGFHKEISTALKKAGQEVCRQVQKIKPLFTMNREKAFSPSSPALCPVLVPASAPVQTSAAPVRQGQHRNKSGFPKAVPLVA